MEDVRELLISEVYKQTPIWDQRDERHHNRYVLDKSWEAVVKAVKISSKEARMKWKNLRADFRKKYVEIISKKSGSEAPEDLESDWPFFNSLLFLADQCTPRKMDSNLFDEGREMDLSIDPCGLDENTNSLDDFSVPFSSVSVSKTSASSSSSPYKRTRKRRTSDVIEENLLAIEKEKLDLLKKKHDEKQQTQHLPVDEDMIFFNSLLPEMKILDPRKKMIFKMEVQKLLFEFCFEEDGRQGTSFRSNNPSAGSHSFSPNDSNESHGRDMPESGGYENIIYNSYRYSK